MDRSAYKLAFQRVREALMNHWDPIGVAGDADAAGEYDAYVPQILSFLTTSRDAAQIVDFLQEVERKEMELGPTDSERLQATAAKLLALDLAGFSDGEM